MRYVLIFIIIINLLLDILLFRSSEWSFRVTLKVCYTLVISRTHLISRSVYEDYYGTLQEYSLFSHKYIRTPFRYQIIGTLIISLGFPFLILTQQ